MLTKQMSRIQRVCCVSETCVNKLNTSIIVQSQLPAQERYWLSNPKKTHSKYLSLQSISPTKQQKTLNKKVSLKRIPQYKKTKQDPKYGRLHRRKSEFQIGTLKLNGFPYGQHFGCKKFMQSSIKFKQQQSEVFDKYISINQLDVDGKQQSCQRNWMEKKQSERNFSQRPVHKQNHGTQSYSLRQSNNILLRNTFEKYINKFYSKRKESSFLYSIDEYPNSSNLTNGNNQMFKIRPNSENSSQNNHLTNGNFDTIKFFQQVAKLSKN